MSEKRRCSETSWIDNRNEWRWLRPMPPEVRFDDTVTERMILGRVPPQPEPVDHSITGCAADRCRESPYAEDDPGDELDRRGLRRLI